jgi:hypothetical protein
MKKCIAVAALALFVFAANSIADEPNKPKAPKRPDRKGMIEVIGNVTVTKDKEGNILAARILTARNTIEYRITLDDKGKELVEKFAGKMADVTGIWETKENVKWLTVEKFTEMKRKLSPKSPKK